MFFLRRLFLKDRAGKFREKILSGRKSGMSEYMCTHTTGT